MPDLPEDKEAVAQRLYEAGCRRAKERAEKVRALRVEELIEQSSLGTPGAKALRRRTPREVVERIMRKIDEADAAASQGDG